MSTKDTALPAWPLEPQGSRQQCWGETEPAQLLLRFCKLRTSFSSGNNIGKLWKGAPEPPAPVRHDVRSRPLWEETEAVTVVLIRFLPGKNSKWAILVIQDSSAVALWHVPNIDYMHSPGLLACLNRVFCRCWCNFPSWDLFSFI